MEAYEELEPILREAPAGLEVRLGGNEAIASDITTQVGEDIARAEALSMPILLVLLVVIFGGLAAASLPLRDRRAGDPRRLHHAAACSPWSPTSRSSRSTSSRCSASAWRSTTRCSSVSRFREELPRPATDTEDALARTMATAGRTVAVLRPDRRDRAGLAAAVPAGVPALDGLRRDGRRAGRDGRRADRAAGAARRARAPGRRAARPDACGRRRRPTRPPSSTARWAPAGPQRDAPARSPYVAVIVPLPARSPACRSCGSSSAASTTGRCRRAPRAGWSPRRC